MRASVGRANVRRGAERRGGRTGAEAPGEALDKVGEILAGSREQRKISDGTRPDNRDGPLRRTCGLTQNLYQPEVRSLEPWAVST
jgi:hypothetical protein